MIDETEFVTSVLTEITNPSNKSNKKRWENSKSGSSSGTDQDRDSNNRSDATDESEFECGDYTDIQPLPVMNISNISLMKCTVLEDVRIKKIW